ncbi:MAG: hypothetical protein KA010_04260 [Saprospiraceae bacterium]|nr:hypothetical protein [Saprospiraceae bacterium]
MAATRCYATWHFDLDFCTFHKRGQVSALEEIVRYLARTKDSLVEAL